MHPILFHIGGLEVRAWGVMVSIGIIAGTLVARRLAAKKGFDPDIILDYAMFVIIAGILGARVWEVLFSWSNFVADPLSALEFWSGGLSIQGAVAGGLLYTLWFIRKHHLNFWAFGDILAPGLILGQAIGRIGCLLNGDAYGIPTSAWFGVVYQPGTPAYSVYGAVPLIPAELMEGAGDIIIFGILLLMLRRRSFKGAVSLAYFVLYSLLRFGLEFLRGDSLMIAQGLKAAQVTSLIIAGTALVIAGYKLYRNRQAERFI